MIHIDLKDKDLFGNDAGEDENIEVLNSYYINNSDFDDFFDRSVRLNVVSARKGMGKSAMISRMAYKLKEDGGGLVIRVTGNSLLIFQMIPIYFVVTRMPMIKSLGRYISRIESSLIFTRKLTKI